MQNLDSAQFCTACGNCLNGNSLPHAQAKTFKVGTRDQIAAHDFVYPRNPPLSPHFCWLNVLIGGLAQIIYGQIGKGLVITAAMIVAFFSIPGVGNWPVCIASIIDAYRVGVALRNGRAVEKWQFFP